MRKFLLKSIQYSFVLLLLVACSTQSGLARKRPPQWVKQRPISSEYYVGIAVVKKNNPEINYIQLAKEQALHDLCSEISVTISANSVLHQFEDSDSFREEFQSNVRTALANEIEGYEMVDAWDNKKGNEYWVYYRLSKNKYQLLKRIKLNKAKKVAQNYFEQAKVSENRLELFQALNYYAKAIDAIKKHLDEDLSVLTLDGKVNLGTDIYNAIQNIFKRTELTTLRKNLSIEISTAKKEPIEVTATWLGNTKNQTISQLPLLFKFTKGDGVINNKVNTNNNGVALSQLSKVTSHQRLQEIEVGIDLSSILDEKSENYQLNKLFFTPELAPKCKIILNVKRLKAYLNFKEVIFGKPSGRKILKNNMKKELSENFFSFTNNKSEAKVILDIKTNVTKGEIKSGRNYKVYIVYLDCFVTLTDNKTGLEIFNDAIYEVRGMKPISYDYAVKEAYDEAVTEIHNTIIPKLQQINFEN